MAGNAVVSICSRTNLTGVVTSVAKSSGRVQVESSVAKTGVGGSQLSIVPAGDTRGGAGSRRAESASVVAGSSDVAVSGEEVQYVAGSAEAGSVGLSVGVGFAGEAAGGEIVVTGRASEEARVAESEVEEEPVVAQAGAVGLQQGVAGAGEAAVVGGRVAGRALRVALSADAVLVHDETAGASAGSGDVVGVVSASEALRSGRARASEAVGVAEEAKSSSGHILVGGVTGASTVWIESGSSFAGSASGVEGISARSAGPVAGDTAGVVKVVLAVADAGIYREERVDGAAGTSGGACCVASEAAGVAGLAVPCGVHVEGVVTLAGVQDVEPAVGFAGQAVGIGGARASGAGLVAGDAVGVAVVRVACAHAASCGQNRGRAASQTVVRVSSVAGQA